MKIGFHIHTHHSHDGSHSPNDIVQEALALGFHVLAITDHNTVKGSREAQALAPNGLEVIIGAEFSTQRGHILSLFIDESIEKTLTPHEGLYDFDTLVEKVHALGGLAILAHPYQSHALRDPSFLQSLDGMEWINGRILGSRHGKASQSFCQSLKDQFQLPLYGGSDAHGIREMKHVYMTASPADSLKETFKNIQSIHYQKPYQAPIIYHKIKYNHLGLKYKLKQWIKLVYCLVPDLITLMGGSNYEVIRVRSKS